MKLVRLICCGLVCAALMFIQGCGGGANGNLGTGSNGASLDAPYASGGNANAVVTPLYTNLIPDIDPPLSNPAQLSPAVTPLAANVVMVSPYTPAQIRTAYQMPLIPANLNALTAAQAAALGAGQTIYIVAAYDDPMIEAELQAFNTQFGLPACSSFSVTTQPLPAPSGNTCQFTKVYVDGNGNQTTTAPAYQSAWASEIALDVQWAHATAPLARLVLIEATDDSATNVTRAIALANRLGPGVVSMSFGTNEDTNVSDWDANFTTTNMSYVAAAGDVARGPIQWPASSPWVLSVGGTSLRGFTSAGVRTETVWSNTVAGISSFESTPSYQNTGVPGISTAFAKRSVADVAFNADPYTGQYVATINPGTQRVRWFSMGGTSLGTPQWAGIIAVLNAQRALASQTSLGMAQSFFYSKSSDSNFYAAGGWFTDITQGSNGAYSAAPGYDMPTGLGTPNVNPLLALMGSPSSGGSPGLVVSNRSVSGQAGQALTFAMTYTSAHAVTWSLSGAPAGMVIDAQTGRVTWPSPVQGSYNVTITATDGTSHASASGVAAVSIDSASVSAVLLTLRGNAGSPLNYAFPQNRYTQSGITYAISGSSPSGLSLSSSGVLSWANPQQGNTTLNVLATYSWGTVSYQLNLVIGAAMAGPVIDLTPVSGAVGSSLNATIPITDNDANVSRINLGVTGVPNGMRLSVNNRGLAMSWATPVAGSYTLTITAIDVTPGHNQIQTRGQVSINIR